jgi:hypothetical protein
VSSPDTLLICLVIARSSGPLSYRDCQRGQKRYWTSVRVLGNLSIATAQRGFHVLALDLDEERFPWKHPNVDFLRADVLKVELPAGSFDFILNCSSVEHVGLQGRYGIATEETDGDLEAMRRFGHLLKSTGRMLLTIVGIAVIARRPFRFRQQDIQQILPCVRMPSDALY